MTIADLHLAESTDELYSKATNVVIEDRTPIEKLLRFVRSTEQVLNKAELCYKNGDQESAYIYFLKFYHVNMQLRATRAYHNKDKKFLDELNKKLPGSQCKHALEMAEKLKKKLDKRYKEKSDKMLKEKEREAECKRQEAEREKELRRMEEMRIKDSQPSVDAVQLFSMSNSTLAAPLLPLGHSVKDLIPKEPYISAIELMHIIQAKLKVLMIDIRTLDEFKVSHTTETNLIFISRDYLDINTRLTPKEVRDLIVIKTHKTLWDNRLSNDVIVIFDLDSKAEAVLNDPAHPISIIRECSTDYLHPNFMNTDLPKVLDGGYESWAHHFPKTCTNPDKIKTFRRATKVAYTPTTIRSPPQSTVKASPIYPELNADAQPKVLPVEIPKNTKEPEVRPTPSQEPSYHSNGVKDEVRSSKSTELRITDVYAYTKPQPNSLSLKEVRSHEETVTTFPAKPKANVPGPAVSSSSGATSNSNSTTVKLSSAESNNARSAPISVPSSTRPSRSRESLQEPTYAQLEPRKPTLAVSGQVPEKKGPGVEYADIRALRSNTGQLVSPSSSSSAISPPPSVTSPPLVDRSSKPRPEPHQGLPTGASTSPTDGQKTDYKKSHSEVTKPPPEPPKSQLKPHQDFPGTSPRPDPAPAKQPVRNPVVNRVIKPLTSREVEAKLLRMNPTHGCIQRGTCGLKNIGNTCFMNAVLQCLGASAPLTNYFLRDQYKREINSTNKLGTKGLVAEEYAFLVKAMWSDTYRHLAPKDWKDAIGHFRPQFLDYSQKDSQEFTSFMLDALHEDLNRVKTRPPPEEFDVSNVPYKDGALKSWESYRARNDSIIVDLFQGQYRSITSCTTCGFESVTFDTFMYLTVPVGSSRTTLDTCIKNFCQSERIEWRCSKCKKMGKAIKELTVWRLPVLLVVIIKRFSYTGMWRDKISTLVDFPVGEFPVAKATTSWMSNPEEGRKYRLYGVTNHTGTLDGGHYVAAARNPLTGDWFNYDDHVIRPMRADQIKKKDAYLLFYTSCPAHQDQELLRKLHRVS